MEIFSDLSSLLKFILLFVFVLALIAATAWLVRRFGPARLTAGRGRQPRLAVIDAASVDGRRKLIIIRRDNVEHLLMIGGPTDVVVETNIVRAGAAVQREPSAPRAADTLPRAVPLPDAPGWQQPEPPVPPRVDRPRVLAEEPVQQMPPPPPPLPSIAPLRAIAEPPRPALPTDPLVGLAAELSRAKPEPRAPEPPRLPLTASHTNGDTPMATGGPIAPTVAAPLSADAHLAEMAQRLENALRRPLTPAAPAVRPEPAPRSHPAADIKRMESKAIQYPEAKVAAATNGPSHASSGNGAPARSIYEDLEQEMASLLGRQSGKS
jgi:hypothetical protein